MFTNTVNMIGDDLPKWSNLLFLLLIIDSSIVVTLNKTISILNRIIDADHVESSEFDYSKSLYRGY